MLFLIKFLISILCKQIKEVIKKDFSGYKLDTTGHSLGGSLSQYVHVLENGINESVTFHPFGVGHTLKKYLSKYEPQNSLDMITNYCVDKDFISGKFSKETQIGKCYELDIKPEYKKDNDVLKYHKIENLEPLSTRKYKYGGYTKIREKNNNHKNVSYCSGSYPVSGYTKADGTQVDGYIRNCYKHSGSGGDIDIPAKYKGKRMQDLTNDELMEAISYFI